ncbi:MAG TPA: HD-GYP domain-containing protein [Firmicutes bacterium]|nr:HD-GYP domain-containing protein [Candidatus Fermentithermobacillaceae bacterium]
MRVVALHEGLEGSILALPVHGDGGRLMLGAGTRLTKRLIAALLSRGYTRVAIEDALAPDIEPEDAIGEETRLLAERALEESAKKLIARKSPDFGAISLAVETIIADLRKNSKMCSGVYTLRSYDQSTYTHSVNVCVIALAIADSLGWSLGSLKKLGIGALLHDIGKILIPISILNKPGQLTDDEYALMKTHSEKGWELLSGCFEVGPVAAHSALEHHERLDGSGYPRHLKGDEISDIGKITAVADVYEAMTSDRPHRKAIFPEAVYAFMVQKKGILFDGTLVDTLFKRIALYPTGTIVSLWGGYVALVTKQDPRSNFRPYVRIVGGPGITKPVDISLYERPDIKINLLLDDYPPDTKRLIAEALHGICEE